MTKEELEKEAYRWTEKNISVGISMYNPNIVMYCSKAYKDGAEPRENQIADIKANCDLAIEGRDIKIKELELELTVEKDQHQEEVELHLHAEEYIKELEKQVKDLEWQLQEVAKDNDYYQHENITLEQLCEQKDKQIAELEKENEKLKTDYEVLSCSVGDFGELQDKLEEEQRKNNGLSDNLTKAVELLKWALHSDPEHDNLSDFDIKWKQAEQFIKENGGEK